MTQLLTIYLELTVRYMIVNEYFIYVYIEKISVD